ncbi:helix-turn-helix domain-containing protein [Peribacillus sp. B-H-3]|uniref:helix-turn-helix domain-containing protein n=1 Tax=Peribacillus sp. B-H-3 TaxID=3400420 RepID=UPI003B010D0B
MKNGRANKALQLGRKEAKLTQTQLSFKLFSSREAISQQETGAYKVQPSTAQYFADEINNPWVAMEAAQEYTNWGIPKLDGDAVDLHRTNVSVVTEEELEEALTAISIASKKLRNNPNTVNSDDIQVIEKAIQESIDAITALNHYVAVLCKEYGISWIKMWTQHKLKLIQRRFLRK